MRRSTQHLIRILLLILSAGTCLVGCASEDDAGDDDSGTNPTDGDTDSETDSNSDTETDSNSDIDGGEGDCADDPLTAGDHNFTLTFDGKSRAYLLHLPERDDASQQIPVVFNFHGYMGNTVYQQMFSELDFTADKYGFAVVYPQGLLNPTTNISSWNAGDCCAFEDETRDDVGFVREVLRDVSSRICVDAKRVYATGMSNGGFMAHYLACHAADVIAAIASVAGVLGVTNEQCVPSRPISVMHFHGTADEKVPYDGDPFRSVPDTISAWTEINGCTGEPTETYNQGQAICQSYLSCQNETRVTLCTIEGMGHCWPGRDLCAEGATNMDISANEAMWEFFELFSLP